MGFIDHLFSPFLGQKNGICWSPVFSFHSGLYWEKNGICLLFSPFCQGSPETKKKMGFIDHLFSPLLGQKKWDLLTSCFPLFSRLSWTNNGIYWSPVFPFPSRLYWDKNWICWSPGFSFLLRFSWDKKMGFVDHLFSPFLKTFLGWKMGFLGFLFSPLFQGFTGQKMGFLGLTGNNKPWPQNRRKPQKSPHRLCLPHWNHKKEVKGFIGSNKLLKFDKNIGSNKLVKGSNQTPKIPTEQRAFHGSSTHRDLCNPKENWFFKFFFRVLTGMVWPR